MFAPCPPLFYFYFFYVARARRGADVVGLATPDVQSCRDYFNDLVPRWYFTLYDPLLPHLSLLSSYLTMPKSCSQCRIRKIVSFACASYRNTLSPLSPTQSRARLFADHVGYLQKCDRKFPQCTACQKSRRGLECNFEAGHVIPQPRPKSLPKGEACAPCRRKKKKCTAERPSCKLCKSTGTEKDCVYEPTWRVLSAADLESISRRNSTTPVSCSEDGESSQTDDYDCLSWTGDCPGDPVYQSYGPGRQIVDVSLRQDYYSAIPHQGYPASCGSTSIGEPKQDGQLPNLGFAYHSISQPPRTTYSSLAEWNG
ncbi:hypothetical protein BDM02DRAFT_612086 [Thelephora ganbajun]|uniref:Uncharacterized protein n=1 Tax=Thelephora ganbajun TaxID=370292 RepID=A0ACB6Z788_THEGA|nr:hypothetical protein BDM02DRAFT_612086 [Thelephora ganbajun]